MPWLMACRCPRDCLYPLGRMELAHADNAFARADNNPMTSRSTTWAEPSTLRHPIRVDVLLRVDVLPWNPGFTEQMRCPGEAGRGPSVTSCDGVGWSRPPRGRRLCSRDGHPIV